MGVIEQGGASSLEHTTLRLMSETKGLALPSPDRYIE